MAQERVQVETHPSGLYENMIRVPEVRKLYY
jgi:hypothetical protein